MEMTIKIKRFMELIKCETELDLMKKNIHKKYVVKKIKERS